MATPFMTLTVNISKKQFDELCLPVRECLTEYPPAVLKEAGVSVNKIMQELYQEPTFVDAIRDNIKERIKEYVNDMVDDPYGYSFDDISHTRLDKIIEHLDEINEEYHAQQSIAESARNFDQEVNATAQQLKAAVALLKSSGMLAELLKNG